MERVFHDLHHRSAYLALRYTSRRMRSVVEHSVLVCAVFAFCVVTVSHRTFVYRSTDAVGDAYGGGGGGMWGKKGAGRSVPSMCLRAVPGFVSSSPSVGVDEAAGGREGKERIGEGGAVSASSSADVIHVLIGDDPNVPSRSYLAMPRRGGVVVGDVTERAGKGGEGGASAICPSYPSGAEVKAEAGGGECSNDDYDHVDDDDDDDDESRILYSYSLTKGFLLLPPDVRLAYNISSLYVVVSPSDANCFGEPFLQRLVFGVVGPDTVAMNWLLGLNDGKGYLYRPKTGDLTDLHRFASEYYFILPRSGVASEGGRGRGRGRMSMSSKKGERRASDLDGTTKTDHDAEEDGDGEDEATRSRRGGYHRWVSRRRFLVFKVGVLLTSLFIFFVITNLVAFTLRETQDRMLTFTFQLRDHVRSGTPIGRLIVSHVVENLVFVPIMVGMVFFLIEFYGGDKFLAFTTLSVVWVCEVFSVISMRSAQGMQFFPRVFFLYFTLFHVYFFSCPFGFSYTSLVSSGLFTLHGMLFFINRFELPAILDGTLTPSSPGRTRRDDGDERSNARRNGADNSDGLNFDGALDDEGSHRNSQRTDRGRAGGSNVGSNAEPFPSFSSMSSLGRGHRNFDDDDDSSFMYFMGGEVVMLRENRSSQSLQSTASMRGAAHRDSASHSHSIPDTPEAISPANSLQDSDALQEAPRSRQSNERRLPLTPQHSNVSVCSNGAWGGGGRNDSDISLPQLGSGPPTALFCFDRNGGVAEQSRFGDQNQTRESCIS